jgi:hypothetical protein
MDIHDLPYHAFCEEGIINCKALQINATFKINKIACVIK